jgi:hypothetical protein
MNLRSQFLGSLEKSRHSAPQAEKGVWSSTIAALAAPVDEPGNRGGGGVVGAPFGPYYLSFPYFAAVGRWSTRGVAGTM